MNAMMEVGCGTFCGGGGGEAGGGGAERNRGKAETAARLAGGMLRPENASDNEAKNWAGAGAACRRVLVTASCNAAEGIPEGTSGEGGTRLREAPGLDAALQRARHMFP
jgi:hypothetical protein